MIRILCESPNAFDSRARGNFNYTPKQVGDMTLDQIYMLLTDWKLLRQKGKGERTKKVDSTGALMMVEDGEVKVRTVDGKLLKLKSTGKSMAQIVAERERKKREKKDQGKKKRRGRR